jgi:hypothetical protein
MKTVDLTLTIPLEVPDDFDGELFQWLLKHLICDWSNGRHRFDIELLAHALFKVLEHGTKDCVYEQMARKYGNETVSVHHGETARFVIEAEKLLKDVKYPSFIIDKITARIADEQQVREA